MRTKKIIIGGLLTIIIISALYGWYQYNRTVDHLGDVPADYSVNAIALIDEYMTNETAADQKYRNRILSVQGMIKKMEDADSTSIIILGDTSDMNSVRCIMDAGAKTTSLQRSGMVTIKGAITGFKKDETGLLGSDVELNRCVIEN
jgi:hypothetical protein